MKRPLALILAVGVLCGCKGQSPPGSDPFFGRTAVPPPPTGSAAGRFPDPYYRGAPGAAQPLAPVPQVQQPGVTLPAPATGGGGRYDPPGGNFNYRGASAGQSASTPTTSTLAAASQSQKWVPQTSPNDGSPSRIKIIEPENKTRPAAAAAEVATAADAKATAAADATSKPGGTDIASMPGSLPPAANDAFGGTLSGRPRVVRNLQPRPQPTESAPNLGEAHLSVPPAASGLQRAAVSPKPVDIMDLPPAGSSSAGAASPPGGNGFRLVSGSDTPGQPTSVVAATASVATESAENRSSTSAGR